MANNNIKDSIIIQKQAVKEHNGLVVLGIERYKQFLKYEMEKEHIDEIVNEGLREKKRGTTESLKDFLKREYPKLYEDYKY